MVSPSSRRGFLRTLAAGTLSLPARPWRVLAQSASEPIAATKLTENFSLVSGAGSNVLVVTQPDGVLMVDGGAPLRAADLLTFVSAQSEGRRIEALFNTHWHLDHTGANDRLGKAGATIIAHENTRLWMGAEIVVSWQHQTYLPRPKIARPTKTFYTTEKMTFGRELVQYGHLGQAHTDGDIYVFFPGPNILMTGDVFSVGSYPVLDYSTGGWIGGIAEAAKTLVGLADARTRIIPGTGPVQTRADLQAHAEMLGTMRTRFVEMMRKGMSAKDMLAAAPTTDFDAKWGNPELFITNAYPGLWNHVREIGGIV